MLADNPKNVGVESLIDKYYACAIPFLLDMISDPFRTVYTHDMVGIFGILKALNQNEIAEDFISKGIGLLKTEIQNACDSNDSLYCLYGATINLALCINDTALVERCLITRIDLLESKLQNNCTEDDQRFEVIEALIAHCESVEDNQKATLYKGKIQELLQLGFEDNY